MFSFFKSKPKSTSHLPQHAPPRTSYSPPTHPDPESGYNDVSFVSSPAPFSLPTARSEAFPDTSYPPRASSHPAPTRGYPSLSSTFTRLEAVLIDTAPSILDSLAPPLPASSPALIALLHALTPYYLPSAVLESYILHDGQDPFSTAPGLIYGLRWMPLDEVEQEWRFWRRLEEAGGEGGMEDAFGTKARTGGARGVGRTHPGLGEERGGVGMDGMSAFPPGWVRSKYSHPGWLPLLSDRAGNYVGVDLDPPPPGAGAEGDGYGQPGQVIAFGREIDEKVVLFPGDSAGGWGRFLSAFVDDVERGEFARLGDLGGASAREWDEEGGRVGKEGSDEEWGEGDGIGDRSYFEGDRYGEEGGDEDRSESQLWTLRAEYRRWLAGPGEGGLIGALAERSRRKWLSLNIGSSPPPPQSTRTPLTILVPEDPIEGPESSATERPSSPTPLIDSSPPLGPLDSSVELVLSPPSPKISRFDSVVPERSPDMLEARRRPPALEKKGRGRPPPPPPMALELPTMLDLDSPAQEGSNVRDDHLSGPYGVENEENFGSGGTPTRDSLLGSEGGGKGGSSTALVQGNEGVGLSLEGLGINAGAEGYSDGGR